ncbi:hypothetical protein A2U01_0107377, partial [Trifolium medium]|nr:hypothetical protein [Trifolium medium]
MVDKVMCDIKIVEEWSFSLGEDACLFEDDKEALGSVSEHLSDP